MNEKIRVAGKKKKKILQCAYCLGAAHAERAPRCWHCGAIHHRDCWFANGGCSQFACLAAPKEG